MIILGDVIEAICASPISDGWLVGGVVERGWSNRDADLIVPSAKIAEGLPPYFDIIVQEAKPAGPSIPVAGLKQLTAFKFEFMKPTKTPGTSNEFYDINDFKNLKGEYYFVEPKYDGIRVQLRKAGYKVWVFTDEGNDITDKLPAISEEARTKIPFTVCVLDCELAAYRGSQRLGHSGVTAFLRSKTPPEDYHMRLKPFDIVFHEGSDIRNKPLADRKKILEKVPWGEVIHPVKYKLVRKDGITAAIEEMTTSEGAMIKDASSTYNKSGEGWYKWKKQYEIDAQVTAVNKKEGGYCYTCKVGSVIIGETYVTPIGAKVGDIITVSVDHVTKKGDGTWGWYAPKVKEIRPDKKEPDPESVLQKLLELARKAGKGSHGSQPAAQSPSSAEAAGNASDANANNDTPGADGNGQGTSKNLPLSEGKFVLQEHWWGDKHHFDLRFEKKNSEGKPIMIGWTLLADSEAELFDKIGKNVQILSKRKLYHDPKWLTFEGDIQPGNEGNPTKNFVAHMQIRDTGHYRFNRRQTDFAEVELSEAKHPELNGKFYLRLVKLNKDSEGNLKPVGEDTDEDWLFWKAKVQESLVNKPVRFAAESYRVIESPQSGDKTGDKPGDEFVDVEVTVLSTNVTANGRQYSLEDLQKNSEELNTAGGLIFAMGKHPDLNEEPDAKDNVGLGQTSIDDGRLKAKARIYNTSTVPDMVSRVRRGLVRDLSIEGFVTGYKKTCNGDGCWQRAFGLKITRAVFVAAGADPHAKIEKVLESIEKEMKHLVTETKTDAPPDGSAAKPVAESASGSGTEPAGKQDVTESKSDPAAESQVKESPPAQPTSEQILTIISGALKTVEAAFGDYKIDFTGDTATFESVFGKSPQGPAEITRKFWERAIVAKGNGQAKESGSVQTAVSEAAGQKYTKDDIKSVLGFVRDNPGIADEGIHELFRQAWTKLDDKNYVKHILEVLKKNPGMMDDDMAKMMAEMTAAHQTKEGAAATVTESQEIKGEKPPRVKESQSTPGSVYSSFYEAVKKLVR